MAKAVEGEIAKLSDDTMKEQREKEIDKLFDDAMKGKWKQVVEAYKRNPIAQKAQITKSEETALHLAVGNGETQFSLRLIEAIVQVDALCIPNERGDTPLHLAAAAGDLEVCLCIIAKNPDCVTIRNLNGETPIFLAAFHGKKEVFVWLHSLNQEDKHLKRENGDTILHVTVEGDYFGLAVKISKYYPEFVNSTNIHGLTPLHILAKKSNAFKSSTSLGLFDRILYNCLVVNELEETQVKIEEYRKTVKGQTEISECFPENYQTCMNLFQWLKPKQPNIWSNRAKKDANSSGLDMLKDIKIEGSGNNAEQTKISKQYPENYQTCMTFFRSLSKFKLLGIKKIWSNEPKKDGNSTHVENAPKNGNSSVQDKKKENSQSKSDENRIVDRGSILSQGLGKLKKRTFVPPNYNSFGLFFVLMMKTLLVILGVGISRIKEIESKKKLHLRAKLVLDEMVKQTKYYKSYGNTGLIPEDIHPDQELKDLLSADFLKKTQEDQKEIDERSTSQDQRENLSDSSKDKKESNQSNKSGQPDSPILIAAKTGAVEMVEKILDSFTVAIQDVDANGKNVVLLAVENRQPLVYNLLLNRKVLKESVFRKVDNEGNSALHLAAQLGKHKPWLIPGSALQMQWEIKWYEYVRDSMPLNFFPLYNKKEETPNDVFGRTHVKLTRDGSEWLTKTSESCSVVAALVATVAFTASSTVPGGVKSESGVPVLTDKPAFEIFAISALVALCFSVTGLVFFLSILTSRYQEKDFASDLPRKLLLGLTSLFASIASMLVSFCSGHIFVLNHQIRYIAYPLYAALCFPVTFFAFAQLSLYLDLVLAILKKVPQRSYRMFPH